MNLARELNDALHQHQTGNLAGAKLGYQSILQRQVEHFDALHLLGVVEHQLGKFASAIDLMNRAIMVNSRIPDVFNNKASSFDQTSKISRSS